MMFRRQKTEEVHVNLTPLIDVVFLLLIFFMVSTTFTKESHLSIDLPEATGQPAVENTKQVEIVIGKEGNYAVNGKPLVNNELKTLITALSKESQGDNTLPLVITSDAKTPYQFVVTAMDASGQLGFVHLTITTMEKPKE